jgi:hypothetical protein
MPHDDFLYLRRSLRLQRLGVEAAAVVWEMVSVADVQQLTNGVVRTKQRTRISLYLLKAFGGAVKQFLPVRACPCNKPPMGPNGKCHNF